MPQREPPIDKATLATLRKQGWPVREIASTYHCSTSYITNLVKRYKLPLKSPGEGRRGGNMGHIEISKRELKEMRDDGLTLGEIAEVFGCGVNLISVSNAFGRWIIVHPENRFLAWTGSRWAAIDDLGFPRPSFRSATSMTRWRLRGTPTITGSSSCWGGDF